MKILIVLIRWKGGVGRLIESLKPFLEKEGHQVEVISREDDLKGFSTKQSFFKLRKLVKSKKYDILYTQDWSCALPLLLFKNHYCCFCGNEIKGIQKLLQFCIGNIFGKKLIVVGPQLKKRFKKSNLIYAGVDLSIFKNFNNKREKNTVGFANWHRNLYNYSKIKSATKQAGLKLIDTNLKLSKKDLVKFYNKIEIFISLPEKFAGFNISWIEAMACGVPKIIGNQNGIGNQLDINHVEDFKDILDSLKNAKSTKEYKINKEFNWDFYSKKLLKVFNENN